MVITIYLYVMVQNYIKKTVRTKSSQRDWLHNKVESTIYELF